MEKGESRKMEVHERWWPGLAVGGGGLPVRGARESGLRSEKDREREAKAALQYPTLDNAPSLGPPARFRLAQSSGK